MNTIGPENRPKAKSVQPLRSLIPFIACYRGTLAIAILALLISSAALLAMPIAVRNVIDHGFSVDDAANVDRYFFILLFFVLVIVLVWHQAKPPMLLKRNFCDGYQSDGGKERIIG